MDKNASKRKGNKEKVQKYIKRKKKEKWKKQKNKF